jgi:FG-GAP-like repeat
MTPELNLPKNKAPLTTNYRLLLLILSLAVVFPWSCQNKNLGEDLSKAYCGSCHLTPDPKLLDRKSWEIGVFPLMEVFVGRRSLDSLKIPFGDKERIRATGIIPSQPLISEDNWNEIVKYYLKNAPEKLEIPKDTNRYQPLEKLFDIQSLPIVTNGVTLLQHNHYNHTLSVGNMYNEYLVFDIKANKVTDKVMAMSPPVGVTHLSSKEFGVTLIGIMNPNDSESGGFGMATIQDHKFVPTKTIQSLARPVCSAIADLNGDKQPDVAVAAYGNYIGDLSWYEWQPNGISQKHFIKAMAGCMQVLVKDMNNDKKPDLVTLWGQGNEGISVFYNDGKGRFTEEYLLRFPPVYGSVSMQMIDFDKDGDEDILYANGDNFDETRILKPYHGVRVYANDGKNKFTEKYFFPIHGTMKSMASDFDKDGDIDIAAISFFPDYSQSPHKGFVYLKNNGQWNFTPYISKKTDKGHWMTMDVFDYDQDGHNDILVGSCKESKIDVVEIPNNERVLLLKTKQ